MTTRSDYDVYMDRLAITISNAIPDGTDVVDVISACAGIMGFALADVPVERRDRVLSEAVAFIDRCCASRVADVWCRGEQG